jgi:hypothetical protein
MYFYIKWTNVDHDAKVVLVEVVWSFCVTHSRFQQELLSTQSQVRLQDRLQLVLH